MNDIVLYVTSLFDEEIIDIKCCSRLFHKNIVFKVSTCDCEYAVKIYYNGNNKDDRFNNEIKIIEYFNDNKIVNVPKIYLKTKGIYGNVLIMEWLDGLSLKKIAKMGDKDKMYQYVLKMLSDLKNIWKIDDKKIRAILIRDKLGFFNRIGIEENKLKIMIQKVKPNICFLEVFDIYDELIKKMDNGIHYVINSDVSVHEFIDYNDKTYWIDFERYRIGDPNNDLARFFYSISSVFYNDIETFNQLFLIFENTEFYKRDNFIYYLIEKMICNIYVDSDNISDEEINTYITFILELYKKNKVKKKH